MIEKTFPITEKLLDKGLELSLRLYDLLTQEDTILKSRSSPEKLALIAHNKKETIIRLEQFSKQLAQIMSTENLTISQESIGNYFQKATSLGLPVSGSLDQWHQITNVGKKCQALNEQNGAAVALLLRHNHRLVKILRGHSQSVTTYGPDGSTNEARFSQPLISV